MAEGEDVGAAGVRAARRERRRRVHRTRTAVLGAVALVAVTAWAQLRDAPATTPVGASAPVTSTTTAAGSAIPGAGSPADPPTQAATTATDDAGTLPLTDRTLAKISPRTRQVVVVEGRSTRSSVATVRFFERGTGWVEVASWSGHVGRSGWTSKHREGDLKTPTGVYTLSDAGGRLPDPGTKLTYDRSPGLFRAASSGPGFGDSAADTFDYVIAIDYNRVRGRSPLDYSRPLGTAKGGGIWLHVDHDGPTHGCVSLPKTAMKLLLKRLTPGHHPVVVMGPASTL